MNNPPRHRNWVRIAVCPAPCVRSENHWNLIRKKKLGRVGVLFAVDSAQVIFSPFAEGGIKDKTPL